MRLLFTILATPALLFCSCSEPSQVESSTPADSKNAWNVQDVTPAAAQKLLAENKNVRVLDVRTPAEYADGHIKGAVNVDFKAPDFAEKVAKLDKDKAYVLHCRSGNRSGKSLPTLKEQGFGTIYHLNKGFNAWKGANMTVEQ